MVARNDKLSSSELSPVDPNSQSATKPVSSLDIPVQRSMLNTLLDIQENYGISRLFIPHNLSMVRCLCDLVIAIYLGKTRKIDSSEALLSAIPIPDPRVNQERSRFHTQCPAELARFVRRHPRPHRHTVKGAGSTVSFRLRSRVRPG